MTSVYEPSAASPTPAACGRPLPRSPTHHTPFPGGTATYHLPLIHSPATASSPTRAAHARTPTRGALRTPHPITPAAISRMPHPFTDTQ